MVLDVSKTTQHGWGVISVAPGAFWFGLTGDIWERTKYLVNRMIKYQLYSRGLFDL